MEVYEKAKSLLAAGRLDEAHTLYSQFIEEQSDSCEHAAAVTDAYNSRGHIRYLWVDFPAATEDYSRAIERDPSFAMAHYNRGQVMYRLGQYASTERDLRTAVQLSPDFSDAHLNLAQVLKDMETGRTFNTANPSQHKQSVLN